MSTDATNGRDPLSGKLLPGHRVSVGNAGGNPHVKLQSQYKRALMEAGSPERVQKVTDAMFAAACDGDTAAAKILLDHWVGRPTTTVEVTGNGPAPIQTDITAIVAIIQQEEPDPEKRLKIARRILRLGQQPEVDTDGPIDRDSSTD